MKRNIQFLAIFALAIVVAFSSCKNDDDPAPTPEPEPADSVEIKSGLITGNETWTSDKIYILVNKVVVDDGASLTIEPGTLIKGRAGQGTLASALVVARGGTINAEGTADNPIIFTAESDNIQRGQLVGTNLDREDNTLWGGVIILGAAPISAENGDTETSIEGIPADDEYGLYGGASPGDNSGVFKYVSIRHGGISIGEGNEINGLTLGGVGNGTVIENVEVYATLDDGIECFGGTVNITNALVYYQGDDGVDLDMNYSGTITNFAVIHGDGIGTDEGLEIDGPEGSTYVDGLFTLSNGILISQGSDPSCADFKSGAQGNCNNLTWEGYGSKKVKVRTRFTETCENRGDAYLNMVNGDLTFAASIAPGVSVYDGNANPDTACPDELATDQTTAEGLVEFNGAGASLDLAATFAWTAAGQRSQL